MICENCKQRIDSYAHGLKCERGSFAERVNEIRSENTSGVTFAAAFTTEPACKVVDATTDALNTIAAERARLRKIIETQADTIKGMKEAIAPAVIEQAARNERGAYAARDVALERADRLERDLAGVREQLDITRRKLEETARFNDLILAADQRGAKMYRDAHPEMTTLLAPDRAGLVAWLLERIDEINDKWRSDLKRYLNAQSALENFMSACADQAIQIMELRGAMREVKPDHPMFNGSGSARAGDATPG